MVFTSPFAHGSLVNVLTTTFALRRRGSVGVRRRRRIRRDDVPSLVVRRRRRVHVRVRGPRDVRGPRGRRGYPRGVLRARDGHSPRGGASFYPREAFDLRRARRLATVAVLASLAPYHDLVAPFAACLVGFLLAFLFYKPEFGASLGWRYRSERRAHVAAGGSPMRSSSIGGSQGAG